MASNEQSVTLLRKNKRAQVEALNSLGFNLTEEARAADFSKLIKWAAGLLDVTVAANRISDNRKFFFTVAEWQSLSATEQALFLLRGVRVRACGQSFIIAPDTITNKAWGSSNKAIPLLHSYSTKRDTHFYYNAYEETCIIAEAFEGITANNVTGAPAAEAALAYKAFTAAHDGLEDTSEWCLPTVAHLVLMFKFIHEINAVFSAVWSKDFGIALIGYWSCSRYSVNEVYRCNMNEGGSFAFDIPSALKAVRPICLS